MESIIIELAKVAGVFIAGGGLSHLVNRKLRKRELANKISREEYESFERILETFMQRNGDLALAVVDIRQQKDRLESQLQRIREIVNSTDCTCRAKAILREVLAG